MTVHQWISATVYVKTRYLQRTKRTILIQRKQLCGWRSSNKNNALDKAQLPRKVIVLGHQMNNSSNHASSLTASNTHSTIAIVNRKSCICPPHLNPKIPLKGPLCHEIQNPMKTPLNGNRTSSNNILTFSNVSMINFVLISISFILLSLLPNLSTHN